MHLKSSFSNSKYSGQKVSPHSNLSYYDTITIVFTVLVTIFEWVTLTAVVLSGGFWAGPAQSKVVKMKFLDFSYWASSTPWGHVLSLKTFCRNPVLIWTIRYSVFQPVKFGNSFKSVCGNLFSTFWHLMVKFGYIKWFYGHFQNRLFLLLWNKEIIILSFFKNFFFGSLLHF